jgi:hypothetical protein
LTDPNALIYDAYSDECTFFLSGKVNKQNCRIWGTEKPHHHREHVRDSPKVIVWCCVLYDCIIGPFFYEQTVNAINYLDMLENFALPQLQEAEAQLQHEIRFQQDGAPPHWNLHVRALLNQVFPSRWIGQDGPIAWPPRSPDLSPQTSFMGLYQEQVLRDRRSEHQRAAAACHRYCECYPSGNTSCCLARNAGSPRHLPGNQWCPRRGTPLVKMW